MRKIIGRGLASLAVGGVFGLVMSTAVPDLHAAAGGAAAAAFMYGSFVYNGRVESREAKAAREADDQRLEDVA